MKTIYDLGAHRGNDTEFYLKKGFKVVAVEANPSLAAEIEHRFPLYIQAGKLTVVNKAIYKRDSQLIDLIVKPAHDDWGAIVEGWNDVFDDKAEKVRVQTITIDSLIKQHGPAYYIKIDIEGYDAECLKSLSRYNAPRYISAELLTPNNLGKSANPLAVMDALLALGYEKFQIVDQSDNILTKCPNPAKEGDFVDYSFDGYSSGLFGRELPREWLAPEDVIIPYLHYFYKYGDKEPELNPDHWYDIHARL
jgi:FkbM family methyltransferase